MQVKSLQHLNKHQNFSCPLGMPEVLPYFIFCQKCLSKTYFVLHSTFKDAVVSSNIPAQLNLIFIILFASHLQTMLLISLKISSREMQSLVNLIKAFTSYSITKGIQKPSSCPVLHHGFSWFLNLQVCDTSSTHKCCWFFSICCNFRGRLVGCFLFSNLISQSCSHAKLTHILN